MLVQERRNVISYAHISVNIGFYLKKKKDHR